MMMILMLCCGPCSFLACTVCLQLSWPHQAYVRAGLGQSQERQTRMSAYRHAAPAKVWRISHFSPSNERQPSAIDCEIPIHTRRRSPSTDPSETSEVCHAVSSQEPSNYSTPVSDAPGSRKTPPRTSTEIDNSRVHTADNSPNKKGWAW